MTNRLNIRPPRSDELAALSALCLRSKAWWGYDADFMAACHDELTLAEADLLAGRLVVAEDAAGLAGLAQLNQANEGCYLEKLFVDTDRIGQGVGRQLWDWAVTEARRLRAEELIVEADPDAAPFYERMGCLPAGEAPSGSIPGRRLPRLVYPL